MSSNPTGHDQNISYLEQNNNLRIIFYKILKNNTGIFKMMTTAAITSKRTDAEQWLHENNMQNILYPNSDSPWWVSDLGIETFAKRSAFIKEYGFAILTQRMIEILKKYSPIIEVGAGSGYWAYELSKNGCDIIATDSYTGNYQFEKGKHFPVTQMKADEAAKQYSHYGSRTLMLVWPCYDKPWAYDALKAYKGQHVIYVGEWIGGCTATFNFFKLLESDFEEVERYNIPQFAGLHDKLYIYKRKD